MAIQSIVRDVTGTVGVEPHLVFISTTDSLATVTTAGYLNQSVSQGFLFDPADIAALTYLDSGAPISEFFRLSYSGNIITLIPLGSDITLPVVADNLAAFSDTDGGIKDSGIATNNVIVNSSTTGQTISTSTVSATPGTIRAIRGAMTTTVTTMTSGNLVGVRGDVTCVGASGGFLYGVQGKVIATGTFSGSIWTAGVFGQLDVSAATMSTAQFAAIWGDYGTTATSGTYAGARGIAMTNTTAAILKSQVYLYGGATNFLELVDNNALVGATYFVTAGTTAGSAGDTSKCNASKVLKITVNGTSYWLPLFASNS